MKTFTSKILKIDVNPYVLIPDPVLKELFLKAEKNKGPIPVHGTLNGKPFIQTLIKFRGKWRLYLNTPMRKSAGIDVGDTAIVKIEFDKKPRIIKMHPKLQQALKENKEAFVIFKNLNQSYQKEIIRYISVLKTELAIDRNVNKAIQHLLSRERFIGRAGNKVQT